MTPGEKRARVYDFTQEKKIKENSLSPSGYISAIVSAHERLNYPSKMSQLVNGSRSIEQIE